ncbi:MAG: twin-arginine translocase TatA/TatE family subunit [Myxococcota bacterium]
MLGLNVSEILLIILVMVLVFGIGQLPSVAEAIGRSRHSDDDAVDVTPSLQGTSGPKAPDLESIQGPVEDAELVDRPTST